TGPCKTIQTLAPDSCCSVCRHRSLGALKTPTDNRAIGRFKTNPVPHYPSSCHEGQIFCCHRASQARHSGMTPKLVPRRSIPGRVTLPHRNLNPCFLLL